MAPPDFEGRHQTMKTLTIGAGVAALAILASGSAFAATPAGPHILVIDRQAVVNGSKLGESIRQQIMGYEEKAQNELGPEGQALQSQLQAAGAKKTPALQAKEAAFRQKVQDRQSMIQGGEMAARKVYTGALDMVVHGIMTERGADAVLEKSSVVDSVNGLDITKDVIARMDKKMASYKVPLVKPSLPEMLQLQQMQRMQQQQGQQQ